MTKRTNRPGRTFAMFLCCVLAVPTAHAIMPGLIQVAEPAQAVAVGVVLGAAYLLARPLLRLITMPLGCLTFGLFHWVIDVGLIYASAYFIEGFAVSSLGVAVLLALFINALIAIVGGFR